MKDNTRNTDIATRRTGPVSQRKSRLAKVDQAGKGVNTGGPGTEYDGHPARRWRRRPRLPRPYRYLRGRYREPEEEEDEAEKNGHCGREGVGAHDEGSVGPGADVRALAGVRKRGSVAGADTKEDDSTFPQQMFGVRVG